jgi:ribosomal protein L19E
MAAIKLIQGEEAEKHAAEAGVAPERGEEGSREGSAGPPANSKEAAVVAMRLYREALTVIEANQEVGKDGGVWQKP